MRSHTFKEKVPEMVKPQLVVRLSPELLEKLKKHAEKTGASKTDVVIGALSQYLGCAQALPLNQKVAELDARMATVEALVKVS